MGHKWDSVCEVCAGSPQLVSKSCSTGPAFPSLSGKIRSRLVRCALVFALGASTFASAKVKPLSKDVLWVCNVLFWPENSVVHISAMLINFVKHSSVISIFFSPVHTHCFSSVFAHLSSRKDGVAQGSLPSMQVHLPFPFQWVGIYCMTSSVLMDSILTLHFI